MRYYEEDGHRAADRKAAGIATAVYIVVLTIVFFAVKVSYHEPDPNEMRDMIVMDFGESNIPTPNIASHQRQQTSSQEVEEDPLGNMNTSVNEGVIESEKKVDSTAITPPREVNTNALYSRNTSISRSNADNDIISSAMEGGSQSGIVGSTGTGASGSFSLEGRTLVGNIVPPQYNKDMEGKIVIVIRVNREGEVTDASYSPQNSTISDAQMIESARKAALQTRFSRNTNALFVQTGTITYNFRLK